MRDLRKVRPSHLRLTLVAMATSSSSAACNKYAGETGIELLNDPKDLFTIEYLDLILELTENPDILTDLMARKPTTIGVLNRHTAMLFFDIATLYDGITERESERIEKKPNPSKTILPVSSKTTVSHPWDA